MAILRRYWPQLAVGFLCLPLHAATVLVWPLLISRTIDGLTGTGRVTLTEASELSLLDACLLLAGLALLEALLRYVSRTTLITTSRRMEEELKNQLMAHIGRLPVAWYDRARTGDLVSRLTQDVELVRFLFGPVILHGGSAVWIVPGGLILMASISLPVTLACAGAFTVMAISLGLVMPRLRASSKLVQESIGNLSQRAQEAFSGIRTIMVHGSQARETAIMARMNRRYLVHNLRLTRLRAMLNAVIHSTANLAVLGVLVVGGLQVMSRQLTIGELFGFWLYMGVMMWPLQALGWTIGMLPRTLAAADRIEELFAAEPETRDGLDTHLAGRLEVRRLDFTYPLQQRPALRGVSFVLEPGQKLGLVGAVGAGKSTILALCLRLYDPPRGSMFLDGHDLLDLSPQALRRTFALAPQEPFLFSDTIEGNVSFGMDGPGAEVLEAAVHTSALDQDIAQLAEGLETMVGERGVALSGGQKQRVSLARALAASRRALILDDTLAAVDPTTERRILARLRASRQGRTMIVATHRLSAVQDADLILVLRDGEVLERGTHDELLAASGLYAGAWRRQAEAGSLEGPEEDR
jgi:ATP-binding cassette subfamily B protein